MKSVLGVLDLIAGGVHKREGAGPESGQRLPGQGSIGPTGQSEPARTLKVGIMNRRRVCQLVLVLAASAAGGAAMGHGGGWGGGRFHDGHFHDSHFHDGHFHDGHFHGGCCHVAVGFFFGPGFVYGYPFYPYPYSYYYPYWPVTAGAYPAEATQYVEQGQDGQPKTGSGVEPQAAYYYHCARPEGYYPYVKACPGGWEQVPTEPPDG